MDKAQNSRAVLFRVCLQLPHYGPALFLIVKRLAQIRYPVQENEIGGVFSNRLQGHGQHFRRAAIAAQGYYFKPIRRRVKSGHRKHGLCLLAQGVFVLLRVNPQNGQIVPAGGYAYKVPFEGCRYQRQARRALSGFLGALQGVEVCPCYNAVFAALGK